MTRGQISNLLRSLNLIYLSDTVRYYIERFKNRKINRTFRKNHPQVKLPPDYLIYESFQINYQKYYTDSKISAAWLADHFKKHTSLNNKKVLDWGCGPGRIIRHLPNEFGNNCTFFGTDYNAKSIAWCKKNIPNVEFNLNTLEAKLPYPDNFFDIIYGISIFTHLSEGLHHAWYNELYRVLNKNGILFVSTQGKNFKSKLSAHELEQFENQELVVRGKVKEGHRTYSAFQPKAYMMKLFKDVKILEHIETEPTSHKSLPQDVWMIQKK